MAQNLSFKHASSLHAKPPCSAQLLRSRPAVIRRLQPLLAVQSQGASPVVPDMTTLLREQPVVWDPEGLLSNAPPATASGSGSLIERKQRERAARQLAAQQQQQAKQQETQQTQHTQQQVQKQDKVHQTAAQRGAGALLQEQQQQQASQELDQRTVPASSMLAQGTDASSVQYAPSSGNPGSSGQNAVHGATSQHAISSSSSPASASHANSSSNVAGGGSGETSGSSSSSTTTSSGQNNSQDERPVRSESGRPVVRLTIEQLAAGGLPVSSLSTDERSALAAKLAAEYMPVDLNWPGLRLWNLDPPVFVVDEMTSSKQCAEVIEAATSTGLLQTSRIGAGNAASAGDGSAPNAYHSRRTSRSMLLDAAAQAVEPRLAKAVAALHKQAEQLVDPAGPLGISRRSWGKAGRLPGPGQYCFESLQVAVYTEGQHFLEHEDAFPPRIARSNGFQRHATLLVYLNEVPKGGATRFELLDLAIKPKAGSALLFFPAFASGMPDDRTLHTAEDAIDTKWVMQQWVARGVALPAPPADSQSPSAAPSKLGAGSGGWALSVGASRGFSSSSKSKRKK